MGFWLLYALAGLFVLAALGQLAPQCPGWLLLAAPALWPAALLLGLGWWVFGRGRA